MPYDPYDGRYAQPVLCGRVQDKDLRLWVDGQIWQAGEVMTCLQRLTALPKKTGDGTGEVRVPLTWAIVTQIARLMEGKGYGWRPDPHLNKWIEQECIRRFTEYSGNTSDLKFDIGSLDRTPMPHQAAGAFVGALNKRFFFCDDMRTGKTFTALLTLAELEAQGHDPFPALVVAPASVVDPWLEELAKCFPDWPVTDYRGSKRKNLSSRYKVYVASWNTFTRDMQHMPDELPPLLKFMVPKTVVMDEAHALCLEFDSFINTLDGPKKISEVREGDRVLGVDHATGRDVWTRVNKVGRSPLRETIKIGRLKLTPDHPVWVSDDGCIAYATNYDEDIHLRPVYELFHPQVVPVMAGAEVLRAGVQVPGGEGEPGPAGSLREGEQGVSGLGSLEGIPGVGSEPVQGSGPGDPGSGGRGEQGCWVQGTDRRERGAYYPARAVAEATRRGVHPRVLSRPGSAATGLPDELQGGSGLPSPEARGGAGRELAPFEAAAGIGRKEDREVGVTWLDGAEVLEYGSPEESLWNLATSTGNYVADGILVHNCNTTTKQSTAAKALARVTEFAYPMSGTPITRDVGGFWTAMNVLDIRSFPDPDRYKDMYTDRYQGDYKEEIDGLKPETRDEFYTLLQGGMRRVAKSDVNENLPPVCYSTRAVDIPPAHRAAYEEMEADMIAHIPDTDEPLEVMTTLAQLQRLTQLAACACDVEVTMELDEREKSPTFGMEVPRYHVTMREPSWKIDELMAIMAENDCRANPLLTFSPHTQLMNLAGARAEKAGYKVGYITGQQSAAQKKRYRLAYQAGELDLMCLNLTAGGVGLTLNRGSTVIMLERSFAHWQNAQGESRADDIMAAKQVYVIDIVARNTVESRVREVIKGKARQLSELVRDPRIVEELLGGQPIHVK